MLFFRRTLSLSASMSRRANIGKAKAVDRGQYKNSYRHVPNSSKSGLPSASQFTVLGIETSCDDTGVAVVSSSGEILGESLASQCDVHAGYGGVVPGLARDAHSENIGPTIADALRRSGKRMEDIDAVAVTVGPGLEVRDASDVVRAF